MKNFWDDFSEREGISYDEEAKQYRWPDGNIVIPIVLSCASCGMTAWMNSKNLFIEPETEELLCGSCAGE